MMNAVLLGIGLVAGISIASLYFLLLRRIESIEYDAKELREQLAGRSMPYKFRRRLEDNELGLDYIMQELERIMLYYNQTGEALNEIGGMAQKLMNSNVKDRKI